MTPKMDSELDLLELSIRARRGQLRPAEQHALAQGLESGAALRMMHELGRDLDVLARVRAGDEALVERAAKRALATGSARPPRRRSRLTLLLAAAVVVASAAAATHAVTTRIMTPAPQPPMLTPPPPTTPGKPDVVSRKAETTPPEARAEPAPAPRTIAPPERAASSPGVETSPPALQPLPSEPTASDLFRQAGAARRAGSLEAARALYVELQARFPTSSEARVSHVSLGKLYLNAGRARDAELEFAKYLRTGIPDLREEALVGRADALFSLGRTAEERNVWHELLRAHPASVYATRARERLGASTRLPGAPSQ
ncbi:MAG TPA: hypothetical protein VGK73_24695 [Polyangiaceae bacterium]